VEGVSIKDVFFGTNLDSCESQSYVLPLTKKNTAYGQQIDMLRMLPSIHHECFWITIPKCEEVFLSQKARQEIAGKFMRRKCQKQTAQPKSANHDHNSPKHLG
jgi:hypothetical protein